MLFVSLHALAQSDQQLKLPNSQPNNSKESAANAGAASDPTDAQIIEELHRIPTRIQELESRLKQRSSDAMAKDPVQTPSTVRNQLLSSSISPSRTVEERTGNSDSETQPAKDPKAEPFAFADWTWLTGNPRTKEAAFDSKFFTPEIRADIEYTYDFNHPKDDTIGGSTGVFQCNYIRI